MRYADKTLLITGGTGRFGRAVFRRALDDFLEAQKAPLTRVPLVREAFGL